VNFSSPAKINLGLDVLRKRSDGYHDIETVFQFLDWGDTLEFSIETNETEIICPRINASQNLVLKAVNLLKEITGTKKNVRISIHKNIPIGSGLGGGSSNAATAMKVLNELWGLKLTKNELKKISVSIGADLPIFIEGLASKAEGVGDILTETNPEEKILLIILPRCKISTKEAFNKISLSNKKNIQNDSFFNFFEDWARNNYREIEDCFSWIEKYSQANLSGTGSSIYAKFNSFEEASKIIDNAPESMNCFLTKSLNRSPLLDELYKIGV
jgi:4-diphosphocytidyl-2-C-methyl-D-erythritol kinase